MQQELLLNQKAWVLVEKYSEPVDQKFAEELEEDELVVPEKPGEHFLHDWVYSLNMSDVNFEGFAQIILD